jgi:hypothetical protein
MPITVSPGWSRAKKTAWFACEPEFGWTFAKAAPNSCFRRSIASCSAHVDELAAAVVALAGVALGVLVGELAALRRHHRRRRIVLRRDQLDVLFLALVLALDDRGDLRVGVGERGRTAVKHRTAPGRRAAREDARGWPRRTARPAVRCAAADRAPRWWSTSGPETGRIASRAAPKV